MSGYQNDYEQTDLDFTCLLDDPAGSLGLPQENEPISRPAGNDQRNSRPTGSDQRFDDQRGYNGKYPGQRNF